ncbi:hypothetical protein F2P56_027114 [Juglans regia]|uniref:Exostosin GT47 domain-containing protein n=2 Tax=Juglans regia TaxID=51240 RepID=A0A833WYX7_JUGRE|nr:probable xyloglucan galactosyltransferase GT14 [Juglans regia]KAF5452079.1 hypothetical protein F2P56_027114 [Juglans regia]
MEKLMVGNCSNPIWFVLLLCFLSSLIFLLVDYMAASSGKQNGATFILNNFANDGTFTSSNFAAPRLKNQSQEISSPSVRNTKFVKNLGDLCSGRYIYIHDLPSQFNKELLMNCNSLIQWMNMCQYVSNLGLGPQVDKNESVILKGGWFVTNQFMLEVIFHNRMMQYQCLTNDSSLASAIYIPFYAGLDVGRYLWGFNISVRDANSLALVKWLADKPEWKRMSGRDHFLVGGRIAWDFRRLTDDDSDWGSKLMVLPESKNITLLTIESSKEDNEFAIPYPTYFHPSKDRQIIRWQKKMRRTKRQYLFSFAGAPRPNLSNSIRSELIDQCRSSSTCNFLGCYNNGTNECEDPINVMTAFQSSVFCLQPPGDSFTRRSTFDSILAGCIPVFFHKDSAYSQYLWHLPKNHTKYSVMIPLNDVKDRKVCVNETLLRVPKNDVLAKREEVIKLIPSIVYGDPRSRLETLEDAFDIAVKGVLERVETARREIEESKLLTKKLSLKNFFFP